jgi:hypothetical protein
MGLYQTGPVPLPVVVIVSLVSLGCVVFLANQIRSLRRRRRNLRHWERDEPLEGRDSDWD